MSEIRKAVAVTSWDFFRMIKELGIPVPDNCGGIIVHAVADDVVRVYWQTFAPMDMTEAAVAIIKRVQDAFSEGREGNYERTMQAYKRFFEHQPKNAGLSWEQSWDDMEDYEKSAWNKVFPR